MKGCHSLANQSVWCDQLVDDVYACSFLPERLRGVQTDGPGWVCAIAPHRTASGRTAIAPSPRQNKRRVIDDSFVSSFSPCWHFPICVLSGGVAGIECDSLRCSRAQ